jgi:DNA-binding NarL/FixJ family response regulator
MKILSTLEQIKAREAIELTMNHHSYDINLIQFSKKLKHQHPKLTRTDLEIACFIVLGKSRREIADLRSVKVSSIKTSRHRLRKKMFLSSDILLDDYLKSIA